MERVSLLRTVKRLWQIKYNRFYGKMNDVKVLHDEMITAHVKDVYETLFGDNGVNIA